nr:ABC transporter permease [Leptospiraceae bacterium]
IGNGLINLVSFPMTICSGVFFSYHGFPDLFRNIVKYFPLTVLADGVRAVFTEGAGLQESGIPILILGITGLIFFGAGIRLYKWD